MVWYIVAGKANSEWKWIYCLTDRRLELSKGMAYLFQNNMRDPLWSWSYGSWIYNYLCNHHLSPLKLWDQIPLRQTVLDTTLCDKVCQWLATGQWFSSGLVSFNNKTDRHKIAKILLKVALSIIDQTKPEPNQSPVIKSPKQIIIIILLFLLFLLSFRGPWTCPRQISGTTRQNFMKLCGVIDICF